MTKSIFEYFSKQDLVSVVELMELRNNNLLSLDTVFILNIDISEIRDRNEVPFDLWFDFQRNFDKYEKEMFKYV